MTLPTGPTGVRRFAHDGTPYIIIGTVIASVAAYLFQVVGGRALGAAAFDPVTALLTVHFLVFTVLLLPVEQFEIRRVTLGRAGGGAAIGAVVAVAALGAVAFTVGTRDRFFDGDIGYALIGLVAVATNALLAVARGRLAGQRRFRAYGLISALAATLRVVLALVFLAAAAGGLGLGWALALGPLVVLFWWPFRVERTARPAAREEAVGRFLIGFVLASAASQVLLLAAPLVVGVLDSSPGLMSIVFVTFQLFRAPIVLTQNLLARFLPPFTNLAAAGYHVDLRRWAIRFGTAAVIVAPVAAAAGAAAGPPIVGFLFGDEFEPGRMVASLAAAGMVLASVSLLAGQVLVARGRTLLLAGAWLIGFVVAIVAVLPAVGGADLRVARAFVLGEAAALVAIVWSGIAGREARSPSASPEATPVEGG
jgi:O-antigen/teichoic acid export membrane protein